MWLFGFYMLHSMQGIAEGANNPITVSAQVILRSFPQTHVLCHVPGAGQQTREQAHDARTEAGTHPVQICDFSMETHDSKKYTVDDLKGTFSIIMFGDSVTDHALQGLHKMQEIVTEQGRLCHCIVYTRHRWIAAYPMVSSVPALLWLWSLCGVKGQNENRSCPHVLAAFPRLQVPVSSGGIDTALLYPVFCVELYISVC